MRSAAAAEANRIPFLSSKKLVLCRRKQTSWPPYRELTALSFLLYLHPVVVTYVQVKLRRPDGRGSTRNVRFLVDSGAIYSVLPEKTWRTLRLRAERQVEFTLADGTPIERGVSECRFEIRGKAATSPVVLGEGNDGALLGAVTLETLGFMLNPLTREILPMRMALSHLRSP